MFCLVTQASSFTLVDQHQRERNYQFQKEVSKRTNGISTRMQNAGKNVMCSGHNNLLYKAVLLLYCCLGLTALALFSTGKIHSADRPATANPRYLVFLRVFDFNFLPRFLPFSVLTNLFGNILEALLVPLKEILPILFFWHIAQNKILHF